MIDKKKALALAIGSSVLLGCLSALIAAKEENREAVAAYMNRQKVKFFVREKLNGNVQALALVDRLPDEDVQRLLNLLESSKDWKESFLSQVEQVKGNVQHIQQKGLAFAKRSLAPKEDWLDRLLDLAEKYLG